MILLLNLETNPLVADCRMRDVWSYAIDGFFHPKHSFDGYISEEPSAYPVTCEVPQVHPQTLLKWMWRLRSMKCCPHG